jgi:hypothetical protein
LVARAALARLSRAISATIERANLFNAVTDNFAAAMIANGRKPVDRTLETIEDVSLARRHNFKRQIIIVAANFTLRHLNSSSLNLRSVFILKLAFALVFFIKTFAA